MTDLIQKIAGLCRGNERNMIINALRQNTEMAQAALNELEVNGHKAVRILAQNKALDK